MRLGLGLSITGRRGGADVPPLYAVSAYNAMSEGFLTSISNPAKPEASYKVVHAIGGADVSEIVMSWSNWSMGALDTEGILLPTQAYRVVEAWLTTEAGASAQIKKDGAASWTVAAGANDVQCDPLKPADFGLSVFARNTRFALGVRFWILDGSNNQTTGSVPGISSAPIFTTVPRAVAPNGEIPTSQLKGYNGLSGSANWGVGGGILPCVMLGRYAGAVPPIYMGVGDSITAGTGDGVTFQRPSGYYGRALLNNFTTPTQYRAALGMGRTTGNATVWSVSAANGANAMLAYWSKYANVLIERFGVNSRQYPAQFNAKRVIWSTFTAAQRTSKFKRVAVALTGQTTSTDGWATVANQTLGSETNPTGALSQINNASLADVGTNLDHYLETLAVRGNPDKLQNDYWRWAAGTTGDGLHPNGTGHEGMAASLRSLMTTIEAAW